VKDRLRLVLFQAKRQPLFAAGGVFIILSCLLSSASTFAAYDVQRHQRAAIQTDEARRCVTAWETREDIRDSVERGTRGGARVTTAVLVQIAAVQGVSPERVDLLRSAMAGLTQDEVDAARAEIPDPDCDLDAAKRRLD
jgi:hypothetical protein